MVSMTLPCLCSWFKQAVSSCISAVDRVFLTTIRYLLYVSIYKYIYMYVSWTDGCMTIRMPAWTSWKLFSHQDLGSMGAAANTQNLCHIRPPHKVPCPHHPKMMPTSVLQIAWQLSHTPALTLYMIWYDNGSYRTLKVIPHNLELQTDYNINNYSTSWFQQLLVFETIYYRLATTRPPCFKKNNYWTLVWH